jgi:diamine N-acetyltransferase
MEFIYINPEKDLSAVVRVLNISHGTVAKEFGFNKEDNPTNNAFIDELTLRTQLDKGIDLYALKVGKKLVGCIAIEKSLKEADTFYIEKVSVLPEYRNQKFGLKLMEFAEAKIKESGASIISIALIDSNTKLKRWYLKQGFIESGTKVFQHLPFRVCFMRKGISL